MQICTITGNLENIGLGKIDAQLRATLDLPFVDETTTPDTLVLPSVFTWNIVDGELPVVELRETESLNLAVLLEIFPLVSPGVYSDVAIYRVYAIIPNAATYPLASFIDTGITNDQLATGALRVAQVMFSDPALIGTITEALNIFRQDTPPVSVNLNNNSIWIQPSTGNQWLYSESKINWISFAKTCTDAALLEEEKILPLKFDFTNIFNLVHLQRMYINFTVQAPNDAENYWSIRFFNKLWTSSDYNPVLDLSVFNTGTTSPGERGSNNWNVNRDIDLELIEFFGLRAVPVGTPGDLHLTYSQTYRNIYGV